MGALEYKMRSIELTQADSVQQAAALITTHNTCAWLLLFNNSRAKHPACKAVTDGILLKLVKARKENSSGCSVRDSIYHIVRRFAGWRISDNARIDILTDR